MAGGLLFRFRQRKKDNMSEYEEFINKHAATAERLHKVGIYPFGFDPGYLCTIDGLNKSVDIPTRLAEIICELVKQVYPEMKDDKTMIEAYKINAKKAVEHGLTGD
jgi:hypothetical protein